jgi:two-component system response regulator YesN
MHNDQDARYVAATLRVIESTYTSAVTLERVAQLVGISPWYLSRIVRRHTGVTFKAHVQRRRVAHACDLLTNSSKSVKEVAAAAGFTDATHLNRHLRKLIGSSARSIRIGPTNREGTARE